MIKFTLNKSRSQYFILSLSFLFVLTISTNVLSQKQEVFTGMLEYKITMRDTAMQKLIPENKMIVYTNDTITRTENFTNQLGKQVAIKHMILNKSYLLLETHAGKFAIPTDHSTDTTKKESDYTYQKLKGKRKILGMKAKRVLVNHPDFEEPMELLYLKKIPNKYLNMYEGSPGLLVKFSILTADGIMDYELVRFNEYTPEKDLFGIPSDYERITLDELINRLIPSSQDMNSGN